MITTVSLINIHHFTLANFLNDNIMIYSLSSFQVYNILSLNIITILYIASPELIYLISESLYLLTTWYTMCLSFVYLLCRNICSGPLPIFNQTNNNSSSNSIFFSFTIELFIAVFIYLLEVAFLVFDCYLCCNRNLLAQLVHFGLFACALTCHIQNLGV